MTELLSVLQSGRAARSPPNKSQSGLILANPVAPAESIEALQSDADEIVFGLFYRDFRQLSGRPG